MLNTKALEKSVLVSIEVLIEKNQFELSWLEHIRRTDEKDLSKIVPYGQLVKMNRNARGQKKRYKDYIRAKLAKTGLHANWEQLADNRDQRRKKVIDY